MRSSTIACGGTYSVKRIHSIQLLYLGVFLASVFFRLNLSIVNREANDDHMTVINFILLNEKLPKKDNCWECFQPKLFHSVVANVITYIGLGKTTDSLDQRIVIAQLINFAAGVITLIVIWIFIKQLQFQNKRLNFLAFALVALNPPWIGISAQATNDAFVILFSTLAIYFASVLLRRDGILNLLMLIVFATLAVSSKTNGWVAVLAIFITILVKTWCQTEGRWKSFAFAFTFLFSVAALATLNPLTQYIINYQKYGTPFLINMERPSLPSLFEKTPIPDGGILSIQDGFFTFHFASLLAHPQIDYGDWNFTPQRTSFWTQLYAKGYSSHFDNYPPSWANSEEHVFMISRGIFVLAILPTALLCIGFILGLIGFLKGLFLEKFRAWLRANHFGLFTIVLVGYLTFLLLYALIYRDFTTIKAIFLFPALLSFIVLFLSAGEALYARLSEKNLGIIPLFETGISLLLVLNVLDIIVLVMQLQQHPLA